jgi:cytochrome P450
MDHPHLKVLTDRLGAVSHSDILVASATAGVVAHQYFKRWEPDSISYLQFIGFLCLCCAAFFRHLGLPYIRYTVEAITVFNTAQLLSIIAYRVAPWHPLAKYPGPTSAKISKLYWWQEATLGRTGYKQAELHKLYDADIVRIGPNWLSVRSTEAIPTIYGGSLVGSKQPWVKSDWYEGAIRGTERINVHQEIDVQRHGRRRKIWDHGFSGKALADYKPEILEFCDKLVRNVSNADVVDMNLQSSYFSFDVMGVLGFGEPFGMLDAGQKHFFVSTLEAALRKMIPFFEVSWIRCLMRKVFPLPEKIKIFEVQNTERFERRLARGSARKDLFTYLLGEEGSPEQLTRKELISDAGLIVVAGSDTTSSLLTWFWYYNTANPREYAKLRAELAQLSEDDRTDTGALAKLPYLNAAINETMRMQPAVPGGLRRLVPAEGAVIAGEFIPAGTTVSVPGFAIQHDPRYWGADCDTYRPERWLEPGQKTAYLPFSFGTRACPGKALALLEARLAVAGLATRFDFKFAPGFSQDEFETGVRDHFTIQNQPLPLVPVASPI